MASRSEVQIDCTAAEVFAVLCDPSTFPEWLVGAQRTVHVDDNWPEVGSSFRHRIGCGPLRVPGSTTVRRVEPEGLLELAAGMGPLGEAVVTFRLTEREGKTIVTIHEGPTRGIAAIAHRMARPLIELALWGRNQASLETLKGIVERR